MPLMPLMPLLMTIHPNYDKLRKLREYVSLSEHNTTTFGGVAPIGLSYLFLENTLIVLPEVGHYRVPERRYVSSRSKSMESLLGRLLVVITS